MVTKFLGITLGLLLALAATKAMHPDFTLVSYLEQFVR